jgi:Family of unknown function (DUF6159)
MIDKFHRSWELFKASITLTLRHRKLLWFPVLTACLTALIGLFFLSAMALPVVLHHTGYHLNQKEHWQALKEHYLPAPGPAKFSGPDAPASRALIVLLTGQSAAAGQAGQPAAARGLPWGSLGLLVLYFVSMFLATFFNVAFYSEIMAALDGRGVSFRRGLATARSRWSSILAWSLLAGVVGWIIRTIEQRLPLAGRIVMGLIGMAWSVAAVFVIPVIVQEQPQRNPVKILQHSALTLKRTWGEGLIGYMGFSAGSVVIFLCSLLPLLLAGAVALALHSVWLMVIAAVLWLLALMLMAYISGVASHVFLCALYKYATEGVVPEPYNQELLDMAWKVKKA